MTLRRWLVAIGAGLALLLLAGRGVASVYTEYLWYEALGASSIWRARALAGTLIWIISGAAGIAFVLANLYAVRRTVASVSFPRRVGNIEIGEELPGRYLTIATVLISVGLGLLLTIPRDSWTAFELARQGEWFGETDPYFQYDLSFWVAWLPLETSLFLWALIALLLVTVVVVFLYAMTRSFRWERGRLVVTRYARRHLAMIGSLMLLLLAWSYRLDGFDLLFTGSGAEGAFSYLDHHVAKPAGAILALLAVAASVVVLITGWTGQTVAAWGTVIGILLLSVLLHQVGPVVARRVADDRDPERRERPYLATRTGYTRRAFAVDRIVEEDAAARFGSPEEAAAGTPLWDPSALAQIGGSGGSGGASAVGWRSEGRGVTALVTHAAGEPDRPVQWTLARFDALRADARGEPVRVEDPVDVPIAARAPLVHAGAAGYVVVADSAQRIAAPRLEGARSRLAHAWSLQNFRLLFGDLPHPSPRLVMRRDVRERLETLTPFFVVGRDIVPVIDGDSLLWIAHLYSATGNYPLSRRFVINGVEQSYFQHAATALVSAGSGAVMLVADSVLDPIARGWIRRFPSLFHRRADLPPSIARMIPPGIDGMRAQSLAFATTGTRTEAATRHVPWLDGADSALARGLPAPIFLRGDGGERLPAYAEVLLDDLERIAGAFVILGGARPRSAWLPAADDARAARWPIALERLQRVPDSVAAVPGGRHARAPARAMPLAGHLLIAQTTYALRGSLPPAVARIAVVDGERVSTGATLADALGLGPGLDTAAADPRTPAEFRTRVTALYDEMRRALQRGDWTAFGAAYETLGRLLGRPPR